MVEQQGTDSGTPVDEWSIDELAALSRLPVRTIREYQTLGIVPSPRKVGRVGVYGTAHLRRLELIAELKGRGYSLAGVGDLLSNWRAGADLGEVLGLDPDQLVHIDEPSAPATAEDLEVLLPGLVPEHLDQLTAAGVIERSAEGRLCVPSPSALQLAREALSAGMTPEQVLTLLGVISAAAEQVAQHVAEQLEQLPSDASAELLVARGRGLLAHSIGRLTLQRIGHLLPAGSRPDLARAASHTGATKT